MRVAENWQLWASGHLFLFKVEPGKKLGVQFFFHTTFKISGKKYSLFCSINAGSCLLWATADAQFDLMSCLPRSYAVPTLAATRAKIPSEHIQLQASARSLWRPRLARCPCLRFAKMLSALLLRLSKRATHRSFSRKEVFIWADSGVFCFQHSRKLFKRPLFRSYFSSVSEWFWSRRGVERSRPWLRLQLCVREQVSRLRKQTFRRCCLCSFRRTTPTRCWIIRFRLFNADLPKKKKCFGSPSCWSALDQLFPCYQSAAVVIKPRHSCLHSFCFELDEPCCVFS